MALFGLKRKCRTDSATARSAQAMRIQFEFSEDAVKELDALKSRLNVKYRGDVLNHALGVLKWLIKQMEQGNKVLIEKPDDPRPVEVVFSELESLLSEERSKKKKALQSPDVPG